MPLSPARTPGVQSWSLREFKTPAACVAKVVELGVPSVELCNVQADFADTQQREAAIALWRKTGIRIDSIGVQTFTGDAAAERPWFEFAAAAGARFITAHVQIATFREALRVAEGLSEEYGVRLALHCHGGYMFGGSRDVLEHLLAISSPRVGLCIDTGWCMQSGGADPADWVRRFAPRIYGVHYKDFTFDRAGRWNDVAVGTGTLNVASLVHALDDTGFDGHAVFEYEGEPANPLPALLQGMAAIAAVPQRAAQSG